MIIQFSAADKYRFIFYEKLNLRLQNREIYCYPFRDKPDSGLSALTSFGKQLKIHFSEDARPLRRFLQFTMKTLFILRHAKSSWDNPDLADFERPLNERGLRAAPFVGNLMRERGLRVDLILSSPARRARQTATMVKEAAGLDAAIRFDERIYEASPISLLYLLAETEDQFDSVLLVGHNPGMEGLIKILSGGGLSMPTAALAQIELNVDLWSKIAAESGKLSFVVRPKDEMRSPSR